MGNRGYEIFQYEGGIRIPRVGLFGPFRLGGREVPIYSSAQIVLKRYSADECGESPAQLAIIKVNKIDIAYSGNGYSYQVQRSEDIHSRLNRDPDLGGRVGVRRFTPW